MIFKSFILGNLVSLCMKILNSVVVVGLYYGFLTTFSMGPSYLFLLRARVIEEGEEGTEKKVSATTGFITGQLMMFISIYYAPLHLALGRPHTITVLALPYLLFHFFWNNHKHFFDYGSTNRNSMRNLSIQFVFLNNLIFQLFNHFILPSSMLVRLVNIYMFRCNNKMLFVTSSFVGWLIGHILFMKWVGLILVWIQQNNSIRSNVLFRSNKYLVSELRNSMARIFSILLFITCVYSLGRTPSPIFTKKLKETSETEESEEETDVETTSETKGKGTKQEQEGSTEEDPSSSLFSEEKEDPDKIDETEEIQVNGKEKTKDEFHFHFKETCSKNRPLYETFYLDGNQENSKFEILIKKKNNNRVGVGKPLVTILFDSKRWNRPFRYIKNQQFWNALQKEMGQYFFYTCISDGKERISFTYPPSLSTFLELIQKKISLFIIQKLSYEELYNHWNSNNKEKKKNLSNEFLKRIQALDKGYLSAKTLEKRTRFCNDKTKKEYLPQTYDPLLSGPYRGKIQFFFSSSMLNKTFRTNFRERFWINKIHLILLITNYVTNYEEFSGKRALFNSNHESFSREIAHFLNLINEFGAKSRSSFNFKGLSFFKHNKQQKMDFENQIKFLQLLFDTVIANPKTKTSRKNATGLKEIRKQVSRWSYKLIDDLEQQEGKENEENLADDYEIRSRKAKLLVIFSDNIIIDNQQNNDTSNNTKDRRNSDTIYIDEVTFIRYSQQSDFRRDMIKGSMRAQRRKITILDLFQTNVHSPIFLDRIKKYLFYSFDIDIFELMKTMFINCMCKNTEFQILDSTYKNILNIKKKRKENKKKEEEKRQENKRKDNKREDKRRIKIAETWDRIFLAQVIRGCVLVTQSILRKYILLPSLIITKNIIRMLFLQTPEWSNDFKDWGREMHIKCTYNGVQLSEKEFPKKWLTSGIQIKILFPFRLKPWHRSKFKFPYKGTKKKKVQEKDFSFLTVFGMEAELPFGSPRNRLSLFQPIFKKLEKKIRKMTKNGFRVLTILEERRKLFQNLSKEKTHWFIKNIFFRQEKKLSKPKTNQKFLSEFKEVDELNESQKKKYSTINNNNWTISELSIPIRSMPCTNYSLMKKKMKNLSAKKKIILNQIEKITKEKKKKNRTSEKNQNISPNKIKRSKKFNSSNKISSILKKKNARLSPKFDFFIKILIETIYIDIFLGSINIPRLNAQLFNESIKTIITKYISTNEPNKKKIDKPNQKKFHFISIIKKSRDRAIINNNSRIFCDKKDISQAYVFYKLSQTKILNLYKLRSIFEYHNLFLKNQIKDYFRAQGLFNSELKEKNWRNSFSLMNQWKNWLRSHYQYKYDLSQLRWSRLIPEKCRNKIYQQHMVEKKKFSKWNFHEEKQLIHYDTKNDFEVNLFANQKKNFQKHARYSLLSYKSINYEKRTYFSIYESSTNKETILYNSNTNKRKFFDILEGISINNYPGENYIIDIEKSPDRKYFDWRLIHFSLRKRVDIESWVDTGNKDKKNTKTRTNKYQIIAKIDKKNISFFDWMGMNDEIQNSFISNFELWFFRKFVILYNTYKKKPWTIPIQFLLLNFHRNQNISNNKKINGNKKGDLLLSISSNEKKIIELENRNHEEKESDDQVDFGTVFTNEEKNIDEDSIGLDMTKHRKKKQNKSHTEVELDFFLKDYLCFQLRWNASLNQKIIDNIKIYCFLLRLTNPREIVISSIQRQALNLNILMVHKDGTLTELMKKKILIIEPVRLSIKTDGQFLLYQIVGILLVHKNKEQINKKYRENFYVDKNKKNFNEKRHSNRIGNKEKKNYDLLVPENILSPKRRRELRIQIYFDFKNDIDIKKDICNGNNIKKSSPVLEKNKNFWREKNKLIKLKFFLWPNFRLEDLACMNRYWFDTNNGSRFSMVRISIYPRLKF
uniref:hypothetical protein RF1 n=1 Tax=Euphorbia tithymaloides TaxID=212310 RepID=UPI002000F56E|nr:hypothetical protein RF1 [Euphorbia tithymaloides]YP_010362694.1 hypothetical protein RF1 [Euphorbia tithymaloides]UNS16630.1 hypothetical protein RF1 [Euphorbia tithymaloides]UNS16650.1 hypothetical protein RF1 [Euphorbia tithymaloides]